MKGEKKPKTRNSATGNTLLFKSIFGDKELRSFPAGQLPLKLEIVQRCETIRNVSHPNRSVRDIATEFYEGNTKCQ